jgi:hypothetical protein
MQGKTDSMREGGRTVEVKICLGVAVLTYND